ncbi:MAG: hypothetical protein N2V78_09315 [Methanophagales archaeon]|nr:hypothetical protein [Methanophagales archaeon]
MIMIHELPFAYLHLTGPAMLVLPQLFENETYSEFVHKYEGYIILDNGAFENKTPISNDKILDLAKEYEVNEIVLPDVWREGNRTFLLHRQFMEVISAKERLKYKLMAVPHGKDILEYVDCYQNIVSEIDYDTLGINRPKGENGHIRPWIVKWLDPRRKNTFHLLSLRYEQELLAYKDMSYVKMCDCSDASHHPKTGKIDWNEPYSKEREMEIVKNINHLNKLAGDPNIVKVL